LLESHNSSNIFCLYLRKSRADQEAELRGEGETLTRHENILLQVAKKLGITITKIYKEIVSGETIASRPEIQSLLSEVEQGIYAGVLVVEVERLARGDTIDQGIISQAFKYSNTMIITPIKIYDPSDEFDEEYFEFGLFMSRREYKTINRRIQRGRVSSIKDGKYISPTPPYGYDRVKIPNNSGYTLIPNPKEAEVVRLIFDLYVNGITHEDGAHEDLGSWKIASYLDHLGIKPRVSERWSATSIRDILKNPVYIGKICWGKRKEMKKVVDGNIMVSRPNSSEYMMHDGLHDPLVTETYFQKTKEIMSLSSKPPLRKDKILQNPLSGLLYCQKCGQLMNRLGPNQKNRYATIRCQNRNCDNISAPIYLIEEVIIKSLTDWLKDYKLQLENAETTSYSHEEELLSSSIAAFETEINELNKQLTKTYEFLEKEIYTTEVYLERNKALTEQISSASSKLNDLKKQYNSIQTRTKSMQILIPAVTSVIESYYSCTDACEKNNLLKEVLYKVTYLKTERNSRTQVNNANFIIELFPKIPQ